MLYSGLTSSNTNEFVQYIRVDDPTGTPAFTDGFVAFGNDDDVATGMANAPQLGSTDLIETNDRRTLSAKLRENALGEWLLWTTFQVMPQAGTDVGETTAHWVALDVTAAATPVLEDDGDIGGEDIATDTYTYFPAVAVDATGNAVFGFSASASTEYVGAYAASHTTTTTAGSVENTTAVQEGVDDYKRSFGSDRWGDYSSVAVDPNDDFWVTNTVALAGGTSGVGTGDGRWGIYLGEFTTSALPVELVAFDVVATGGGVRLQWTTASETNNAGFAVERRPPGEEGWAEAAFVAGAGTTTEAQSYSHTLPGLDPGGYAFRLKQVDYDGKATFYPAVEVFVELAEPFRLSAPAPSPFRDRTAFTLAVARTQPVRVEVFDVAGRRVALLHDGAVPAHTARRLTWTPDRLAPGVYLVRATGDDFSATRTVLLAR